MLEHVDDAAEDGTVVDRGNEHDPVLGAADAVIGLVGNDHGIAAPGIVHLPEPFVALESGGGKDDGLLGPDEDLLPGIIDVAFGIVALQPLVGSRQDPRGIAGLNAQHPTRELSFPDQPVGVAIHEELSAFLPGSSLKRPDQIPVSKGRAVVTSLSQDRHRACCSRHRYAPAAAPSGQHQQRRPEADAIGLEVIEYLG